MPIYAYRCSACGFQKDVLQKFSDAPLTVCPSCGKDTFGKQVTAPAFQLKGTGWYVTDFRDNGRKPASGASSGEADGQGSGGDAKGGGDGKGGADAASNATTSGEKGASKDSSSSGASSAGSSSGAASSGSAAGSGAAPAA